MASFRNRKTGETRQARDGSVTAQRMASLPNVWEPLDRQPPSESDRKAVWVDFAVAQGAGRSEAEAATKADLIAEYGG